VTSPIQQLTRELRERPVLIVGGAVVILLLVAVVSGRQGDEEPIDDASLEEVPEDAGIAVDEGGGSLSFGSSYALPSYSSPTSYDPFATDQETQAVIPPEMTPDGCRLPKPTIPDTHAGKGDWVCSSGVWTWQWKTGTTTPPPAARGPRITIAKGSTFRYFKIVKGKLVKAGERKAANAVTWKTSNPPRSMKSPGGSTIRVVQLKSGQLAGKWVGTGAGRWVAK